MKLKICFGDNRGVVFPYVSMNPTESKIEKGRKWLLVLIVLGLALPIGLGLYFAYLSAREFIQDNRFLNLWDYFLWISVTFLAIFLVGFWIARKMYKGKVWAHYSWCLSGIILGLLFLFGGFMDASNNWAFAIPGFYTMLIGVLSSSPKSVQLYLASVQTSKVQDMIDQIGKD